MTTAISTTSIAIDALMEAAVSGIHLITDRFIDRIQIGHKFAQPNDARALVYPAEE